MLLRAGCGRFPVRICMLREPMPAPIMPRPSGKLRKTNMLQVLRKSASSIVIKVLLLLLVVSFAILGIGDMFHFGGCSERSEARSVGKGWFRTCRFRGGLTP